MSEAILSLRFCQFIYSQNSRLIIVGREDNNEEEHDTAENEPDPPEHLNYLLHQFDFLAGQL